MKVGFYSPLPPQRTGVADYAATLIPQLRRFGAVEIAPASADVCLYHVANNSLHREIYSRALQHPGVVVLHDAVLQHFFLSWLDEPAYVQEFTYNYGEWSGGFASELWRNRARSAAAAAYFRHAMLRRILERSRAVIVHNPAAARIALEHCPGARIVEIAHLFQAPELPSPEAVFHFRERLGILRTTFVFGVFGYLRESKRVLTILRAFEQVHRKFRNTALLLAGEFASRDLARAIHPLLRGPGIHRIGYLPEPEFWTAAQAADACINLRYPGAGETSGISVRMMGIGKPVLVTEGLESSRYPDAACLRVDPGPAECESLVQQMTLLISVPALGPAIGRIASDHIRRHHAMDQVAGQYWNVLCDCR